MTTSNYSVFLPNPLVPVQWLMRHHSNPAIIILDATLGESGREAIPGARLFDLEGKFSDLDSSLPHMMPDPKQFEREARALGIRDDSLIVIYDQKGVYSSPRARLMFRCMGHRQVAVLDGGLPAWIAEGANVERREQNIVQSFIAAGDFTANPQPDFFLDANAVAVALRNSSAVVIDVRSEGRFRGDEAEPRPGLRPGHMPGALNLPFQSVLNQGRFRSNQELKTTFAALAKPEQQLIFTCGSGVTACIGALAAELAGYPKIAVYDGSWSEWGLPSSRPVEVSENGKRP